MGKGFLGDVPGGFGGCFRPTLRVYDHKGEKERAIADYRAALSKNPALSDRRDIETALERLGTKP